MPLQLQQTSSFALLEVPRTLVRTWNARGYVASIQGQLSVTWIEAVMSQTKDTVQSYQLETQARLRVAGFSK